MPSKEIKPIKVNLTGATKALRPQLHRYLTSVAHKIDGRSYQKFQDIFTNSNKPKLIKTYEELKRLVDQHQPKQSKITMKMVKPAPQKDYLLNVILYSDQPQIKNQRSWKGLYMMFPTDPHRQYQVKAPKIFPQKIVKQLIRMDKTKQEAKLFKLGIQIFLTDDEFESFYDKKGNYIVAFKIFSVDSITESKSKHKPLDENLKDVQKISMNSKYIETKLDTSFNTFKEAIAKTPYTINECWLNTLMDVYGDSLMASNKREIINREKILQILGKTEETVKDGISVNHILPFFKKYNLQLRVFDEFMRPILKYDPEKPSHHHKVLYCLVKGNHVYTLNNNLKELQQKINAVEDKMVIKASENYYIKEDPVVPNFKMIDGIDDIIKVVRDLNNSKDSVEIKLIHKNNNLTELIYNLKESGYEPSIKYAAGHITRIELVLNKTIKICIASQQLVQDSLDGDVSVETENIYNKMNQAMANFNHALIKPELKSYYSKTDVDILDEYRTIVPTGRLSKINEDVDVVEIDISKAFTAAFLKIDKAPVFNEFDYFRPYDNHTIKDYYLYIVKSSKTNFILNKTYNILYGMFLNVFVADVEILAFKAPSFIKPIDTKAIIDNLWNTEISPDADEDKSIKKLIANVNFGLLEKSNNKVQKSKIYETLDEAKYHQEQYGGRISRLSKFVETVEIDEYDLTSTWDEDSKKYYILNISDKAQLKNGFRYFKELLLQFHNFKMFTDHSVLKNNGIKIFSVKSDALTIRREDLEKAKSLITFSSDVGGWRLSKTEDIKFPFEYFMNKKNIEIKIDVPHFERVEIKDEYDTNEICEVFEKYKRVIVRADMPGCGKSYACEKMKARGHNVLFVCPTNKLVQNYRNCGVTMNKFFSIGVDFDAVMSKFDSSAYDVVVFDEIYFSCIKKLAKIKQYCDLNPDKIIIATGDTQQLEPIEKLSNQINYDEYADHCVNSIFNHEIYLTIPKRVKSDEDKLKMKQLKEDVFNEEISILEIINKYFKFTKNISQSNKNIAYLNTTCSSVAEKIRKKLNKTSDYEVGEKLICRKWFKVNKDTFNVNFEYEITRIDEKNITIYDDSTKNEYIVPIGKIKSNFIFAYCGTCHSYQGSSIDESLTIFDYKYHFVDRKWIWTSITRATDLNNVWFYEYNEKPENISNIKSYFNKKIEGYKLQDSKANRNITDNYVNVDWLMKCINKRCTHCGCNLELSFDNGFPSSNITAQRTNNEICHSLDNIVPMCVICNCSLSNKF
jgi:hypothetical protein